MRTMVSALDVRTGDVKGHLAVLLLGGIAILTSYGIVQQPGLVTGLVIGAIVLAIAMIAPLALVALMLATGAIDMSFMTGGFKSLFPHLGGLDMNGIRLVGATVGFLVFIFNAPEARRAIVGKHARLYILFLAFAGLTLANSFDPLEGLRLYLKLTYPLLTFLLVVGLCDTPKKLERLMVCTLVAAALVIFVVTPLFSLVGGYEVDYLGFRRIRSVSGHENPFSFYLMILLFIGFTRLVYRKQLRYLVFCIGAGVLIMLTLTRITFLATIVGLMAITLISATAQRQYRALFAGLVVALVVAVPGLPFILDRSLGFVPTPRELFGLISDPVALYQSINWQGRTNLWPVVWTGFMASPIIGLGLGSSTYVIRQHFPTDATSVAHNEYLRLAADTGIIGVLLFATAMIGWLIPMVRYGLMRNAQVAEYAIAAVAGIIGWALIAITDNPFDSYMYFTQYIGLLVAGAVIIESSQKLRQDDEHLRFP
jgi:O-antigen ligase